MRVMELVWHTGHYTMWHTGHYTMWHTGHYTMWHTGHCTVWDTLVAVVPLYIQHCIFIKAQLTNTSRFIVLMHMHCSCCHGIY